VQSAARAKGVQLPILKASTESEIDSAFALVQLRAGALVIATDPFLNSRHDSWWRWRHNMPFQQCITGATSPRPAA
jgi:hypothetical protein